MGNSDFILKIGFLIVGAMLSALGGLFVWGIQKLASTLMTNTMELIKLNGKMNEVTKLTDKIPKIELDVHEAHRRIRTILKGEDL